MDFSTRELERYSRHLSLPEFGIEGQRALKHGSVLLVGAGGLGSPAALYLAAAGVGRIGIVESDTVELSNLQRQVLYTSEQCGQSKARLAAERLRALNPEIEVVVHEQRLEAANALELMTPWDVILDGTDNFPTRYLVNDCCVLLGKPNCYGSIFRFDGQASVFCHDGGPCYRCVFPAPPPPEQAPSCAEGGVLGVLPALIGSIQACEAIKLLAGIGDSLSGRLLLLDALRMDFTTLRLRRDPACPACGERPVILSPTDLTDHCAVPGPAKGADTMPTWGEMDVVTLESRRKQGDTLLLLDIREDWEREICTIPGALWIPMGQVESRLGDLPASAEIVVQCRSGVRSRSICSLLAAHGYDRLWNLSGGILAWGRAHDPEMPTY